MLRHCVEVAFIAGMMAEEIGLDGELARRCGLLHDIGKAADHEAEGGHPKIGAELLKRYSERPEVVHAAERPPRRSADRQSRTPCWWPPPTPAALPGPAPAARLSSATSSGWRNWSDRRQFPGRRQAYAIQAGREIRVMVSSKETTDEVAAKICHDMSRHSRNN